MTPRNYTVSLRHLPSVSSHYAIIGMARVEGNFPLYFDAMNEKGLCVAGLNFVGFANYNKPLPEKQNVAQFELVPWLLCSCDSCDAAVSLLQNTNITDTAFSDSLAPASLHWLLADSDRCVTVEQTACGLKIYDNSRRILTNNPPFEIQIKNLEKYAHLSTLSPEGESRGLGAVGLPGDLSSRSRFVRGEFVLKNSPEFSDEKSALSQFFHILDSVSQPLGSCRVGDGFEHTLYSSCCIPKRGIYCYTTYQNRQITAVDMHRENLNSTNLARYSLLRELSVKEQN